MNSASTKSNEKDSVQVSDERVGADSRRLGVWWIAEDQPNTLAIVDSPSGSMTYAELAMAANRVVHALRSIGLADNAVVSVLLPNDRDTVIWWLGCQQAGWQFLPLNWQLSAIELGNILQQSGAAIFLAHNSYADLALAAVRLASSSTCRNFMLGSSTNNFESADDLLNKQPTSAPGNRSVGSPLAYTSGTTGHPKGVLRARPSGDPSVAASVDGAVFSKGFRVAPFLGPHLVSAAMHHVAVSVFTTSALNAGQGLLIMPKFDPQQALRMIEEYGVVSAYMVPTMFHRFLQLPKAEREKADVSSLRSVIHSAAPCPHRLKEQMMQWWGPVIWEVYGGTESPVAVAKPDRWLEKPGTVGRALRGLSIAIVDDQGQELPLGEPGIIQVTSDQPAFQYINSESETVKAESAVVSSEGQCFTLGDIGYLDEDGYLFICDRAKDMIITGGQNVYPAEVEAVLLSHSDVRDVAVIGLPNEEWGEEIKAVVVFEKSRVSEMSEQQLIAFCRERLAGFKCPRSIDFVTQLPRTEAGKMYKRLLRDQYRAESEGASVRSV